MERQYPRLLYKGLRFELNENLTNIDKELEKGSIGVIICETYGIADYVKYVVEIKGKRFDLYSSSITPIIDDEYKRRVDELENRENRERQR